LPESGNQLQMSNSTEFDKFTRNYREIHDKNLKLTGYPSLYFAERKIREISNLIDNKSESLRILDLGCGDGLCAFFLQNYFPSSYIHGLDISNNSIQKAQQRKLSKTRFSTYDGQTIPYENEYFNIILLANMLHHVADTGNQILILSQCYRTLKKNGTLFVFEHNPFNPMTRHIVNHCVFDKDAVLITHYKMNKILRYTGFVTTCRFIHFLPAFLHKLEFLEKRLWWVPIGGQYYYICIKDTH
jgi:ubiquinone/menaquinone biosynthesis C-methylase UbiE